MKTMLKCSLLAVIALAFISCAPPANTNTNTNANANANNAAKTAAPTADSLMALENKAWEAYKNKDGKYFETFLTDMPMLSGGGEGSMSKADAVKMITQHTDDIKSYTLSEPHVTPVGADVAVLTYKGVVDGTSNGKPIPSPVTVATVFVRSGSDWKAAYHNEVPVIDPTKAGASNSNSNSAPAANANATADKKETPAANANSASNSNSMANSNSASNTNSATGGDAALTDALLAQERKGWEGWKSKDAKALDEVTTGGKDLVFVDSMGKATFGKDAAMKMWTTDNTCSVSSVTVSDGKSQSLTKDVAILVYKGTAVGTCGGMSLEPLWGTTVFLNEGGTWKAAYLFESPMRSSM